MFMFMGGFLFNMVEAFGSLFLHSQSFKIFKTVYEK